MFYRRIYTHSEAKNNINNNTHSQLNRITVKFGIFATKLMKNILTPMMIKYKDNKRNNRLQWDRKLTYDTMSTERFFLVEYLLFKSFSVATESDRPRKLIKPMLCTYQRRYVSLSLSLSPCMSRCFAIFLNFLLYYYYLLSFRYGINVMRLDTNCY